MRHYIVESMSHGRARLRRDGLGDRADRVSVEARLAELRARRPDHNFFSIELADDANPYAWIDTRNAHTTRYKARRVTPAEVELVCDLLGIEIVPTHFGRVRAQETGNVIWCAVTTGTQMVALKHALPQARWVYVAPIKTGTRQHPCFPEVEGDPTAPIL